MRALFLSILSIKKILGKFETELLNPEILYLKKILNYVTQVFIFILFF